MQPGEVLALQGQQEVEEEEAEVDHLPPLLQSHPTATEVNEDVMLEEGDEEEEVMEEGEVVEEAGEEEEVEDEVRDGNGDGRKPVRKPSTYKCGACGQSGHNSRTCPTGGGPKSSKRVRGGGNKDDNLEEAVVAALGASGEMIRVAKDLVDSRERKRQAAHSRQIDANVHNLIGPPNMPEPRRWQLPISQAAGQAGLLPFPLPPGYDVALSGPRVTVMDEEESPAPLLALTAPESSSGTFSGITEANVGDVGHRATPSVEDVFHDALRVQHSDLDASDIEVSPNRRFAFIRGAQLPTGEV